MCPLEQVAGSLSLKIQQLNVSCDTKVRTLVYYQFICSASVSECNFTDTLLVEFRPKIMCSLKLLLPSNILR